MRAWPFDLPTALSFDRGNEGALPARFADDDVSFSEELVGFFVERLTDPGDAVLDPFAGFGTTLVVAESLGREAFGVEVVAKGLEFRQPIPLGDDYMAPVAAKFARMLETGRSCLSSEELLAPVRLMREIEELLAPIR